MTNFIIAIFAMFSACAIYFRWRARWRPYDPSWLVDLAKAQFPDEEWLHHALSECKRARHPDSLTVHFVDNSRPNKPGSTWQFDRNIILEDPEHGDVVLDILSGNRVGAVEQLGKMLARGA